jgi:hypothetical protein
VPALRTPVLALLGLALAALFAFNVASLADETGPWIWAAAVAAALAGVGLFVVLLARPPAFVDRLTGARRGLLPIVAAGIAVLIVGSAPAEGQLVALAFCAGVLAAAGVGSILRARRPR